jgi:hypothetical protein
MTQINASTSNPRLAHDLRRISTLAIACALALAIAALTTNATTADASSKKKCGIVSAVLHGNTQTFRVETKNVSCPKSRRIVRKYWEGIDSDDSDPANPATVDGFKCRRKYFPEEPAIRCTRDDRRIWAHWTNENDG